MGSYRSIISDDTIGHTTLATTHWLLIRCLKWLFFDNGPEVLHSFRLIQWVKRSVKTVLLFNLCSPFHMGINTASKRCVSWPCPINVHLCVHMAEYFSEVLGSDPGFVKFSLLYEFYRFVCTNLGFFALHVKVRKARISGLTQIYSCWCKFYLLTFFA